LKDGVPAVDLEIAQARVASAEAVLRQLELTAPFDGTITDVRAQSGAPVTVGTLAFRMEDRSRLLVDVTIAEMDINRIRVDMPVIITFDSIYNKEYKGRVVSVSLSGERNSGVVTYPVTVELEDPDELVRSGMSAVVKISVDTVKDALLVPNKAVRMINNQRVVYVQKTDNPMPVKVNIQLGLSSETVSEVLTAEDETDGLQPGDLVVTNPDLLVQMEQSN
jgi:HlyD family secretion protein